MKIAVVDYHVTEQNPIGSCHRRLLEELADEHDFTVFAVDFDNPRPDRIAFVRIRAPRRPLALLFLWFRVAAKLHLLVHRIRERDTFDVVQFVESNAPVRGGLAYAHFCHRAYLRLPVPWRSAGDVRGLARLVDHLLHAATERRAMQLAADVVVPSKGLADELRREYPACAGKVSVIPNPIDVVGFARPNERYSGSGSLRMAFVALGHFERKGLRVVLQAMRGLPEDIDAHLTVVGGRADALQPYADLVERLGLDERVTFVGLQADVRPFLWQVDALVMPTSYEAMPLGVYQAAAAGAVLVATPVNGIVDILDDGVTGLVVERTVDSVGSAIRRLAALPAGEKSRLAHAGAARVAGFGPEAFAARWRQHYRGVAPAGARTGAPVTSP